MNDTQQLIRQLMRENLEAKLLLVECLRALSYYDAYHIEAPPVYVKKAQDNLHNFLKNFRVLRWEDTRPATGHTIEAKVEVVS